MSIMPLSSKDAGGQGWGENCKDQRKQMISKKNCIFKTQQGRHTYEFTEAGTGCIRPAQAQARQNPSVEKYEQTQSPTSNQEYTFTW